MCLSSYGHTHQRPLCLSYYCRRRISNAAPPYTFAGVLGVVVGDSAILAIAEEVLVHQHPWLTGLTQIYLYSVYIQLAKHGILKLINRVMIEKRRKTTCDT